MPLAVQVAFKMVKNGWNVDNYDSDLEYRRFRLWASLKKLEFHGLMRKAFLSVLLFLRLSSDFVQGHIHPRCNFFLSVPSDVSRVTILRHKFPITVNHSHTSGDLFLFCFLLQVASYDFMV